MDDDQLQDLIDRWRAGDEAAFELLLERSGERLHRLTGKLFGDWPAAVQGRHDLDSVFHDSWLRFRDAVQKTRPADVEHFFKLAARKIRHVLLDMADQQRRSSTVERLDGDDGSGACPPRGLDDTTWNPSRLALFTELHRAVDELPDLERTVFEEHYYLGRTQVAIAKDLSLEPRDVSRLWVSATQRLADRLEGLEELL